MITTYTIEDALKAACELVGAEYGKGKCTSKNRGQLRYSRLREWSERFDKGWHGCYILAHGNQYCIIQRVCEDDGNIFPGSDVLIQGEYSALEFDAYSRTHGGCDYVICDIDHIVEWRCSWLAIEEKAGKANFPKFQQNLYQMLRDNNWHTMLARTSDHFQTVLAELDDDEWYFVDYRESARSKVRYYAMPRSSAQYILAEYQR